MKPHEVLILVTLASILCQHVECTFNFGGHQQNHFWNKGGDHSNLGNKGDTGLEHKGATIWGHNGGFAWGNKGTDNDQQKGSNMLGDKGPSSAGGNLLENKGDDAIQNVGDKGEVEGNKGQSNGGVDPHWYKGGIFNSGTDDGQNVGDKSKTGAWVNLGETKKWHLGDKYWGNKGKSDWWEKKDDLQEGDKNSGTEGQFDWGKLGDKSSSHLGQNVDWGKWHDKSNSHLGKTGWGSKGNLDWGKWGGKSHGSGSHKFGSNGSHKSGAHGSHKSGSHGSHKPGSNESHKFGSNGSHKSGQHGSHKSGQHGSHTSSHEKSFHSKSVKSGSEVPMIPSSHLKSLSWLGKSRSSKSHENSEVHENATSKGSDMETAKSSDNDVENTDGLGPKSSKGSGKKSESSSTKDKTKGSSVEEKSSSEGNGQNGKGSKESSTKQSQNGKPGQGKDKDDALPVFGPTMKPPYRKEKTCKAPTPACCCPGQLRINLGSGKGIKPKEGNVPGVDVKVSKAKGKMRRKACSSTALLTADFEKLDNTRCFGCLEAPYCGRRMLKVELQLSYGDRKGWLFNMGDSESNDGFRGDAGHQLNNAELQGLYPNITVYPSDCHTCGSIDSFMHVIDGIRSAVRTVTFYLSNNHIRVTNDEGLDFKLCHHCLFALNGQPDHCRGGPNERIFIALNRVIKDMSKTGYGVCSAIVSWACPWCDA